MRKVLPLFFCLFSTAFLHAQLNWQRPVLLEYGVIKIEKVERSSQQFPIKMIGGLIFVQAKLEGNIGHFILDTGAPTLVVNRTLRKQFRPDKQILGITGQSEIGMRLIHDFRLGQLKTKPIEAIDVDMSHLEKLIRHPIEGLIGYQAINNYELLLDYEQQQIELLKPNGQPEQQDLEIIGRLPFELMGHFPVIKVQIGKRTYHFGIDTGAETNLIARKHKRRLRHWTDKDGTRKYLQGVDKGRVSAYFTQLNNLHIAGKNYDSLPFTFTDISHLNSSRKVKLDGILGYPFLKSQLFSINFKDQEIRIWAPRAKPSQQEEDLMVKLTECLMRR
ncbi:MAG: aspartyl protease family protein [Bacteroidota bacterium]